MQTKSLNICLHDVVKDTSGLRTVYDTAWQQVKDIVELLEKLRTEKVIDSYHIFFDDGYKSSLRVVQDIDFGVSNKNIHLAIITNDIGKPNKLTAKDIMKLSNQGFTIDSHGVSHAALAIFAKGSLLPSLVGGNYKNTTYGKGNVLSTQEIQYQLIESSTSLAAILGYAPASFVLPYGLYNKEVISLTTGSSYSRIYTCDSALDGGQFLAPRLLVTQKNINHLESLIKTLPLRPKLLV